MPKFYAVKKGYHTGIFDTWEECQKEVSGYSGAEFKSFPTKSAAEEYLGINQQISLFEEEMPAPSTTAVAYVDGSYNISTKQFAYGAVIFYKGEEYKMNKAFSNPEMAVMRNVAGEIEGSMCAMRFCVENGIDELELYYDYEGIEKWCTGQWKTNKEGPIAYKRFYDEIKSKVKVTFNKVKGHSGDRFNDMADRLAKDALGIE